MRTRNYLCDNRTGFQTGNNRNECPEERGMLMHCGNLNEYRISRVRVLREEEQQKETTADLDLGKVI